MIKFLGFIVFIFRVGVALAVDGEFGHPLFRTFTAHDYGEVGQIFAVAQDFEGRMLFGGEDAILTFDNNRWESIAAAGTGYIRSLVTDSRGAVWFSSSTQVGYLSRIDGEYHLVRIYNGPLGQDSRILVAGAQIYFVSEAGLLLWKNGHISQQPWPTDSIIPFSAAVYHGKIWVCDRSGSIYEFDGDRFNKIAESPVTNAGDVRGTVDCPIGEGLMVRSSGIFQKTGATVVPWRTDIDSLLRNSVIFNAKWILGKYLAVLIQNRGVYILNQKGHLVESFTVNSGLADAGFLTAGEDRDGGLWIGTDTEITRIQCATGFTKFDHELGLPKGFVGGVARFDGKIYAATQHGLYVLKATEDASESPHFVPFGDRTERFFGITVNNSTVLACSETATYSLDLASSSLDRIGSGAASIYRSRTDPKRLFLSTRNGLESIYTSNGLTFFEDRLSKLPYFILGLGEDEKGNLFICTESDGFYRIQLKEGAQPVFRDAGIDRLLDLQNRKVPSGQGPIVTWQGEILFTGADRVWKLVRGKNRLEPFELTAKGLPGRKINTIDHSRLTDDYVWVVSRPPHAGAETGFEVGRLYHTGIDQRLQIEIHVSHVFRILHS